MWPFSKKVTVDNNEETKESGQTTQAREFSRPTAHQQSMFENAINDRRDLDLQGQNTPISQIIASKGAKVRGRARVLATSNPTVESMLKSLVSNVIGPSGFRLSTANKEMAKAWAKWCKRCDVTGEMSLDELVSVLLRSWVIDGDGLAVMRQIDGDLSLQVIDAALLDYEFLEPSKRGRGRVVNGIELSKYNRKRNYLFAKEYEDLTAHDAYYVGARGAVKQIPAGSMLHLYTRQFPGQVRGISLLYPVLGYVNQLGQYVEAEVVSRRVSSSKMGFITRNESGESLPIGEEVDQDGFKRQKVEAGSLDELPHGAGFVAFDPQHQGDVDKFSKLMLRQIASGWGMSYMSLSGDLDSTSYSSGRIGLNNERDQYQMIQNFVIDKVIFPLFEQWARLHKYDISDVEFSGRRWAHVDPAKEAAGFKTEHELGTMSKSEIIRKRGEDPDKVFAEIAAEQAMQPANQEPEETPEAA